MTIQANNLTTNRPDGGFHTAFSRRDDGCALAANWTGFPARAARQNTIEAYRQEAQIVQSCMTLDDFPL